MNTCKDCGKPIGRESEGARYCRTCWRRFVRRLASLPPLQRSAPGLASFLRTVA